jgi:hypothetical protein
MPSHVSNAFGENIVTSPFQPPLYDHDDFKRPTNLKRPVAKLTPGLVNSAHFPVAMVAYNRPKLLERALSSLLSLDEIDMTTVTVYQAC